MTWLLPSVNTALPTHTKLSVPSATSCQERLKHPRLQVLKINAFSQTLFKYEIQ